MTMNYNRLYILSLIDSVVDGIIEQVYSFCLFYHSSPNKDFLNFNKLTELLKETDYNKILVDKIRKKISFVFKLYNEEIFKEIINKRIQFIFVDRKKIDKWNVYNKQYYMELPEVICKNIYDYIYKEKYRILNKEYPLDSNDINFTPIDSFEKVNNNSILLNNDFNEKKKCFINNCEKSSNFMKDTIKYNEKFHADREKNHIIFSGILKQCLNIPCLRAHN